MPQLPTSTAEEFGAEDEIKQYNQEEDECSDTSTVDVVNDIKDDLLNEDGPDSVSCCKFMYQSHFLFCFSVSFKPVVPDYVYMYKQIKRR